MTVLPFRTRAALQITVTPDEERVLVAPVGDLDLATAEPLEEEIKRLQGRGVERLVLDLRGVTFLDSTGLRVLVTARAQAMETGKKFALIDGAPAVCRVLDITGLRPHFEFETTPA